MNALYFMNCLALRYAYWPPDRPSSLFTCPSTHILFTWISTQRRISCTSSKLRMRPATNHSKSQIYAFQCQPAVRDGVDRVQFFYQFQCLLHAYCPWDNCGLAGRSKLLFVAASFFVGIHDRHKLFLSLATGESVSELPSLDDESSSNQCPSKSGNPCDSSKSAMTSNISVELRRFCFSGGASIKDGTVCSPGEVLLFDAILL